MQVHKQVKQPHLRKTYIRPGGLPLISRFSRRAGWQPVRSPVNAALRQRTLFLVTLRSNPLRKAMRFTSLETQSLLSHLHTPAYLHYTRLLPTPSIGSLSTILRVFPRPSSPTAQTTHPSPRRFPNSPPPPSIATRPPSPCPDNYLLITVHCSLITMHSNLVQYPLTISRRPMHPFQPAGSAPLTLKTMNLFYAR